MSGIRKKKISVRYRKIMNTWHTANRSKVISIKNVYDRDPHTNMYNPFQKVDGN